MNVLDIIAQFGIGVCGCSAVWLVGRKERWRRWGYVMGLIGQPFWFYTTAHHGQWGIFALSAWYAYSWGMGLRNHWNA